MNSFYHSFTKNRYSLIMIFLITVINYWKIFKTYFQQDEWYGFSQALFGRQFGVMHLLRVLGGYHLTPFSNIFFSSFFYIFGFNASSYATISLFLHCLTSFFVFFLSMEVFKKKSVSLAAAIIFAVSNTPEQAVTYFGTSLGTIPAALLGIASLYFFILSDKAKQHRKTFFTISLLLLLVGLGFKEDIIGLFLFYTAVFLINKNKIRLISITVLGISYFLVRVFSQVFSDQSRAVTGNMVNYFQNILLHIIDFYPKAFSQIVFTQVGLLHISKWVTGNIFTVLQLKGNPEATAENFTSPLFAYIVFFIFLILFAVFFLVKKDKIKEKKTMSFLISLIIVSIFPFTLLPSYAVMESRHFYFPMVGGSMGIAYALFLLFNSLKKAIYKIFLIMLFCAYIYWNISLTHEHLVFLTLIAKPRISFVHQMQNLYENIPTNVIFYASGNSLPLQSGPGEFLMVLFHNKQNYNLFFKENYFWDHLDSYQEKKNIGFGFFYNKELFLQSYKKYNLRPENVVSFNWDDKQMLLTDKTSDIRKELHDSE